MPDVNDILRQLQERAAAEEQALLEKQRKRQELQVEAEKSWDSAIAMVELFCESLKQANKTKYRVEVLWGDSKQASRGLFRRRETGTSLGQAVYLLPMNPRAETKGKPARDKQRRKRKHEYDDYDRYDDYDDDIVPTHFRWRGYLYVPDRRTVYPAADTHWQDIDLRHSAQRQDLGGEWIVYADERNKRLGKKSNEELEGAEVLLGPGLKPPADPEVLGTKLDEQIEELEILVKELHAGVLDLSWRLQQRLKKLEVSWATS